MELFPPSLQEIYYTNERVQAFGQRIFCASFSLKNKELRYDWQCEKLNILKDEFGDKYTNPLQCSCLENPRDGGAWWAAVYGVSQSQTRLKRLSSSSSSRMVMGCPGGSGGKESACSAGNPGLIPGSGRSPGEGNGYPLQYSSLENSKIRGAWFKESDTTEQLTLSLLLSGW